MKELLAEIDGHQKEIDAFRPLSQSLLEKLQQYYKIGLTYSSNALEGNSLTATETRIILEDGLTIGGKSVREHEEAIGHGEAYDLMYKLARKQEITEADIKKLHHLFYFRIDEKNAGKYRKEKVFISGSKYTLPNPKDIPELMRDFVAGFQEADKKYHPVEFSAWVHKECVFIHPFVDGNGRVSRLLMNLVLLQKGFVIAAISPVLRQEYCQRLEDGRQDDKGFMEFIARTVREGQLDYLRLLRN